MSDDTSLLVLVTEDSVGDLPYRPDDRYDSVTVVNLTSRTLDAREVVADASTAEVHVHDIDERFTDVSERLKGAYVDFVESIPRTSEGGRLGELEWIDVSFWWIAVDQFKSKSADFDHTFNRLCRAICVDEVVERNEADEAVVLSEDGTTTRLYASILERSGVEVRSQGERFQFARKLLAGFLLGLVRVCVESVKTVVARALSFWRGDDRPSDRPTVLLFSRSQQWEPTDWARDRYFGDFHRDLESATSLEAIYAVHLSDRGFFSALRALAGGEVNGDLTLLHANLGVWDYARVLSEHLRTTVGVARYVHDTDGVITFEGVDVSPLLRDDLFAALVALPHALLQYESLRKEASECDEVVVTPHFESKIGRMVVAAADATPCNSVVGIQHGPITSGKLQYHLGEQVVQRDAGYPLPEAIAVDGEYAREVLSEGGYPTDEVTPIGGLRYQDLSSVLRDGEFRDTGGSGPIVVFFGLSDYQGMTSVVVPVTKGLEEDVLLKPHPAVRRETIEYLRSLGVDRLDHCEIVRRDAQELISEARLVVSSYSSTAVEAVAFGKPVICVVPRNRLDPTPFDRDLVPRVRSERDLRSAIDAAEEPPRDDVDRFLDRFFGPTDGRAGERLAMLCRSVADDEEVNGDPSTR